MENALLFSYIQLLITLDFRHFSEWFSSPVGFYNPVYMVDVLRRRLVEFGLTARLLRQVHDIFCKTWNTLDLGGKMGGNI